MTATPANRPIPWGAVLLLAFSAIVLLISALSALIYAYQGVSSLLRGNPEIGTSFLVIAAGTLARMLLLLPACYYALVRIMDGRPRHLPTEAVPTWALVVLWLAALGLGTLVIRFGGVAPLLIPALSVLGAIIPIWLILRMALRRLEYGSDLRRWGTFSLGSTAGPFLSGVLEVGAIVVVVIAFIIYVVLNPSLTSSLESLALRLQQATTEEAAVRLLLPYMLRPGVIFLVILGICVVTPMIEEAIKPIGVWLGAGKLSRPAQGFALGALCGAGFALFENFSAAASGGPDWTLVIILRVGTAIMHIANSALMGWALVGAWSERRYLRLGLIYAGVICVHGLWNLLAITYGLSSLPPILQEASVNLNFNTSYALPGMVLLAGLMFAVLLVMNRRLREPPFNGLAPEPMEAPGTDLQV